jgi:PAS domain S-box-containing protein
VKAINLVERSVVQIVETRCIECGACYAACDHAAIDTKREVEKAKQLIAEKRKVICCIDPACIAAFPPELTLEQLAGGILQLGFWDVADVSESAAAVASEYYRLAKEGKMQNICLSFCPAVCSLFEHYYPDLCDQLTPLASPMILLGRMLKKDFTSAAVVYVGSCIARYDEAKDVRHSTEVNAVLSIDELLSWLQEEGIDPMACEEEPLLSDGGGVGQLYPISGGLLKCIDYFGTDHSYQKIAVSGIDDCVEMLDSIRQGKIQHTIVEMSACRGGCINGSSRVRSGRCKFESTLRMERYVESHDQTPYFNLSGVAVARPVIAHPMEETAPTEDEIKHMLYCMGLENPEWQLNCGSCGYPTCRQKAIAVLQKKAELSMCLTALRRRAESITNYVFDEIPLMIIIVDESQKIVEFNKAACRAFQLTRDEALEKYIFEIMDPADFQYVLDMGMEIKHKRTEIGDANIPVEASFVFVKAQGVALGVFQDVTEREAHETALYEQRLQSAEMAQKVIDKQMSVVQQIAYLLGETTAETKVTLNRLKEHIMREGEDL